MSETGLEGRIRQALTGHPSIADLRLSGSRARGEAGPLSDWDFEVVAADPAAVRAALPLLVAPLAPLAQQCDPLSPHWT